MRTCVLTACCFMAAVLLSGCGAPGKLRARGRILKDGAPLVPAAEEAVRVMFVPMPDAGQRVTDFYMANFNRADGTFRAAGKDGQGVPPGKYRIAIEHLRDRR